MWKTVKAICTDEMGEDYEFVNVIPMFGAEHVPCPECWCDPEIDWESGIPIIIHNQEH